MDGDITISNENKKRNQVPQKETIKEKHYGTIIEIVEEERFRTITEIIEEKRYGTSNFLRIPQSWRSLQGLQEHLTFEAKAEKDENGVWFLIFKKVTEPCRQT